MSGDQLIKDLYIFEKRKGLLKKERELSEIITEELAIFRGAIHFNNDEDKTRRLFNLMIMKKEKEKEIDKLSSDIKKEKESYGC